MERLEPRQLLDSAGPWVTAQEPLTLASDAAPLGFIRLTFNEAIDPASFAGADDVVLKEPQGFAVAPVAATPVAGSNDTQFDLTFAEQNLRGAYRLSVGPQVLDVAGNPMNQDRDATNGEAVDAYSGTLTFAQTVWSPSAGPEILYLEDFESWSPAPSYWSFSTVKSGTTGLATEGEPHSGTNHLMFNTPAFQEQHRATAIVDLSGQAGETDLWLDLWAKSSDSSSWIGQFSIAISADGQTLRYLYQGDLSNNYAHYAFDLDQAITAAGINLNVNGNVHLVFKHEIDNVYGTTQDIYLDDVRITANPTMPLRGNLAVVGHSPAEIPSDGGPLNTIRLTFNGEVIPATFSSVDVLLLNAQGLAIDPVTVTPVAGSGNTQFDLTVADQDLRGRYRLTVGPSVHDIDGNPMNPDGDFISGEATDVYAGAITFRPTTLVVVAPPETVLWAEGFESWPPFPSYWEYTTTPLGNIQLSTWDAHSGTKRLNFQPDQSTTNNQSAALLIDLSAHASAANLYLEFYAKPYYPGYMTLYPELSNDGTNWLTLSGLPTLPNGYQRYVVDIANPVANSTVVSLDSPLYLRLRLYRPSYTYTPSLALDDLRLLASDLGGPKITAHTPSSLAGAAGAFSSITVTFDEAIDPATFGPEDVSLQSPFNRPVSIDAVTAVPGSGNTQFAVTFADQTLRGRYRLEIGPNICDVAGNAMNQNGNYLIGETTTGSGWSKDSYTGTIDFAPLAALVGAAPERYWEGFDEVAELSEWRFQPGSTDVYSYFEIAAGNAPVAGGGHLHSHLVTPYGSASQAFTLLLDVSGQSAAEDMFLTFWAKKGSFGQFHMDLSGDGSTWKTSVFVPVLTTEYTLVSLDFDRLAQQQGISLDADVFVRFRHFGSSSGWGESDLYLDEVRMVGGTPALQVVLSAETISENAGPAAITARVVRSAVSDAGNELAVSLASDDISEATVPAAVVIPAGSYASGAIPLDVHDDALLDDAQTVTILATAAGFVDGIAQLHVTDYETLAVAIAAEAITERDNPTSTTLTVTRSNVDDLSAPLNVNLLNGDSSELDVPAVITIPANQASHTVPVSAVEDLLADGPQLVQVSAEAAGYALAVPDSLWVEDSDGAKLGVEIPISTVDESLGGLATTATIRRGGDTTGALVVRLTSSHPRDLWVPASVTIPAAAASATFEVHVVNDPGLDGNQAVQVTAVAADHSLVQASYGLVVTDDDTAERRTIGGRFPGPLPAGTYEVLTDIEVLTGATLTIEPGATLRFSRGTGVSIDGALLADGEQAAPILFISGAASPAPGDWDGITIANYPAVRTVLDYVEIAYAYTGVQNRPYGSAVFDLSHADVHHSQAQGVLLDVGYGSSITSNNVRILDSKIHHNGQEGVAMVARGESGSPPRSGSNEALFSGNEVSNNATGIGVYAAYYAAGGTTGSAYSSPTVKNNYIHHNTSGIYGSAYKTSGSFGSSWMAATCANNLVVHNTSYGMQFSASSGTLAPRVTNNTIAYNGSAGVWHATGTGSGFSLRNNIVAGNARGIEAQAAYTPAASTVGYNDVWSNAAGNWINYPAAYGDLTTTNFNGTPADAEMNISDDPLFADPAGGDFHVLSNGGRYDPAAAGWVSDRVNSPAIDAGSPADSYAAEPQPNGSRINLGAYGNTSQASKTDTVLPTATTVTVSDNLLTDGNVGPAKLTVTVDFSEVMNTAVAPTLTFVPAAAATLTFSAGQSGWLDTDTYVATYDVADADVDEDAVRIDVSGAQDAEGNVQQDFTAENALQIDTANPRVATLSPADDSRGAPLEPVLAITFGESVSKAAGDILLRKVSDDAVVETIGVAGAAVSVSGATATIVTSVTLDLLTDYYVEVSAGAFADLAGNDFAGVSGPTAWNFTAEGFRVTGLLPVASGLVTTFNAPLDRTGLNLYDGAGGTLGPADLTVRDNAGKDLAGSVVVGDSLRMVEWVATGSGLPPGTYTVSLKSGAAAFRDTAGNLLDGDNDGTSGGDFSSPFTVVTSSDRVLSVPDFARGTGQPVNIPNADSGLPIRIDNAVGVTSLAVDVVCDQSLLQITAATLAAGMPTDWSVSPPDTSTPGVAKIRASGTTPLSATNVDVVRLTAAVPSAAPYGAVQAIRLENVSLNTGAIAAIGDVAVHKAAYLGDADGSGIHSSADAFLTVQAALGLASGFAAHAWTDPRIVGDADGSGVLSAADAFLIVQEGLGLVEPFVPDNPKIDVTQVGGGIDPQFQIGVHLPAAAGGQVSVPVKLQIEPAATNVGGFDFDLYFDPSLLTIQAPDDVSPGADTTGSWVVAGNLIAAGHLRVVILNTSGVPLAPGVREVAQLLFSVDAGAAIGVTPLDIAPSDPSAGGYTWTAADGSLWIGAALDWHNEANPLDVNGDGVVEPLDALIIINYINAHPGEAALPAPGSIPHQYCDVNDDGDGTAWDVLIVMNHLNAEPPLVAEGETRPTSTRTARMVGRTSGTTEARPPDADRLQDQLFGDAATEFWPVEDVLADLADDIDSAWF